MTQLTLDFDAPPLSRMEFARACLDLRTDECVAHPWPRSHEDGYAGLTDEHGQRSYVHRWIATQVHGPCPHPGWHAAHNCGNAACCNPAHIAWKSAKDNALDRVRHGRHHGPGPHLTPRQRRLARLLAFSVEMGVGEHATKAEVASRFRITPRSLRYLTSGR